MKVDQFRRNLQKSEDLLAEIRNFVNTLKVRSDKSSSGANLLDFPTYEILTRLTDFTVDMCKTFEMDPKIVDDLLQERAIVEKKRPLQTKDKSDVTFPLSAVDENDNIRARPECLLLDSDAEMDESAGSSENALYGNAVDSEAGDEAEDDDDEEEEEEEKEDNMISKKPTPNVKSRLPLPENNNRDDHIRINRMKKRILKSSLIKDLKSQYSGAPEEIREHQDILDDGFRESQKSRAKYEEDYFIRLSDNKRKKHAQTRKLERGGMDELLSFGKYLLPNADDNGDDDGTAFARKGKRGDSKPRKRNNDGIDTPPLRKKSFKGKKKSGKRVRFV